MLHKIFLALALCWVSFAYAYDYHAEVEMKDGSIHEYNGSTNDGRMRDHWGHDPADIARETVHIAPWD